MQDAGVDLYALSYDEPEALADFARAHGIEFPLLSDPESRVIAEVGILNTLIPPDDHPWYGIPFPGTYVLDGAGTITAKFFEHSLAIRPSSRQLLRAALGHDVSLPPAVTPGDDEVTVAVAVDADELAPGIVHDLHVTFAVPEGQHLYRDPVPPGMVAASVELETEGTGLIPRPMVAPPTRPLTLSGTGDVLQVYEGSVVLTVPFTHNGSGSITTASGREVAVRGVVRWQACDDEACGLPRRMSFDLRLPVGVNPRPDIGRAGGPGHRPMNGDAHFARMTERRR